MKLIKLYRVVTISFSSLRSCFGDGLGVIFDVDTICQRQAMRVLAPGGWKWQIHNYRKVSEWDCFVETDQFTLDEMGMDLDGIEMVKMRRVRFPLDCRELVQ